jgi:hypothetical protein
MIFKLSQMFSEKYASVQTIIEVIFKQIKGFIMDFAQIDLSITFVESGKNQKSKYFGRQSLKKCC